MNSDSQSQHIPDIMVPVNTNASFIDQSFCSKEQQPSNPDANSKSKPHLGDIMSSTQTKAVLLDNRFSPIERIALTCNGNLQRILSAYFNAIVSVEIERNTPSWLENNTVLHLERLVHLRCDGRHCCTASSEIQISNKIYQQLVLNDDIGIGQLFRHLNLLPEFKLLNVSKEQDTFSRKYALSSPGIICIITEIFPTNLFREEVVTADTVCEKSKAPRILTTKEPSSRQAEQSEPSPSETCNLRAVNSISTYHVG